MEVNSNRLKETIVHGDHVFPVMYYYHELENIYLHWHNQFEIFYVEAGELDLNVDLVKYKIHKGDFVLISPNKIHSGNVKNNERITLFTLIVGLQFIRSQYFDSIDLNYIGPLANSDLTLPVVIRKEDSIYPDLHRSFFEIIKEMSNKEKGYELYVRSKVLSILADTIRTFNIEKTGDQTTSEAVKKIKKVVEYVDMNLNSSISIEDISSTIGYSKSYFCRFFKLNTNQTFITYVNTKRIEKSCSLLVETDLPVTSISFDVGIDDLSYFIKLFKRYKCITPSEYRQLYNNTNRTPNT